MTNAQTKYQNLLKGWSFKQRLSIVFLAALFSNAILASALLFQQQRETEFSSHIRDDMLKLLVHTTADFRELSDLHATVFQLLENNSSRYDEEEMYVMGSRLLDRLDTLIQRSTLLRQQKLDSLSMERIDALAEKLLEYRSSTVTVIEMLSVNIALSTQYIIPAVNSYKEVNSAIADLVTALSAHMTKEMDEKITATQSVYWPLLGFIVGLTILISYFLLRIIQCLSRNIQFVEDSIELLSKDITDIEIPEHIDRSIQTLTTGIEHFRQALIEKQINQKQLMDSNRQLQMSLNTLNLAKEAAEASLVTKTYFLANMSHELRTPLNAISGAAQLLQSEQLSNEQQNFIQIVIDASNKLDAMLCSILDYSLYSSTDFQLESHRLNLQELIDSLVNSYQHFATSRGLTIRTQIDNSVPAELLGDSTRVQQIIDSLLANAIKFSNKGEIAIRARLNTEINCAQLQACPSKHNGTSNCSWLNLHVEIEDHGIGIAKEHQDAIFDSFNQVDNSHTRQFGGTGLGLAIARQLVGLMDGRIGVDSAEEQGATFWFEICLQQAPALQQQASA